MPVLPTTSSIWAAVQAGHTMRLRAEVWDATASVLTLYPTGGSVTIDATRAVRRNMSMTLTDYDGSLLPTKANDYLAPFSNQYEIRVWRGVTYADGTYDEAPLGVFRITDVQADRDDEVITLTITGEDRAWAMSRKTFTSVYPIAADTSIATALGNVVADRLPGVGYSFAATTYTTPDLRPGFDGATDPWEFCRNLANAAGQEAYFDADGNCLSAEIPQLGDTSSIIQTFSEGSDSTLLNLSRPWTLENVYNGVRVTAEGTEYGVAWQSVAWDDDPGSPVYRDPAAAESSADLVYAVSTPLVRGSSSDTGQTDKMATALLQTVMGQQLVLEVVPNPALDVRDSVRVISSRLGVNTVAMIDSITIPFEPGSSSTITARARRLS